jgi:hypothetical protein
MFKFARAVVIAAIGETLVDNSPILVLPLTERSSRTDACLSAVDDIDWSSAMTPEERVRCIVEPGEENN